MKHKNNFKIYLLIAFHLIIGFYTDKGSLFIFYYPIAVLIYGLSRIAKTKNRTGEAHFYAGYLMGLEVFLRMCSSNLIWEFGKYSVICTLLFGLFVENRIHPKAKIFMLYFILLTPSIVLIDPYLAHMAWRECVSSYLSGPLCLAVSSIYFYSRILKQVDFYKLIFIITLPLLSCISRITFHLNQVEELVFGEFSNFDATGGFGPNQVSTALGMGVIIMSITYFFNKPLYFYKLIDLACMAMFIGFNLLTFSRGGIYAAGISIALAFLVSIRYSGVKGHSGQKVIMFLVIIFMISQTWMIVNEFTSGALSSRYRVKSPQDYSKLSQEERKEFFTGRDELVRLDFQIFLDNPLLGVGPAMSIYFRTQVGLSKNISAHTEYSRALAEHGIFGLFALALLLFIPLKHFFKTRDNNSKILIALFAGYALLTMLHAAMRLSSPGFLYGLAFCCYLPPQPKAVIHPSPVRQVKYY